MLDGLLGRGFVAKCKSLIKPTKTRLQVLRKRVEAKQRFLKEDLAKLLSNGLDINAYGRTEEFLAGLCLLSHYEFIEYTCDFILKNLTIMQKQRECPENCREAVASLMFAAARFSDLPELRDLRDAFQERYGNSIEHFVNQVFVDKLASRPPTLEKRLQLLRDIALEFSIKWDSRGFEQRMATPSAFVQDQHKKYGPPQVSSDRSKYSNGKDIVRNADKRDVDTEEMSNIVSEGKIIRNGNKEAIVSRREEVDISFIRRQEHNENKNKALPVTGGKREDNNTSYLGRLEHPLEKHRTNGKDDTALTVRSGSSSRGKSVDNGYKKQHGYVSTVPEKEEHGTISHGKSEVFVNCSGLPSNIDGRSKSSMHYEHESRHNTAMSEKNVREDEADRFKSFHNSPRPPPYVKLKDSVIPAPYVKPKESNYASFSGSNDSNLDGDCSSIAPSPHNKANAVVNSPRNRKEKDHHSEEGFGPTRLNGHGHEKDPYYQNDIPLPKPRSLRRKPSKSSSNHHDDGKFEDTGTGKRGSSSRRKEHSRKGLQLLFDDEHHQKDEEERMMDKLLIHYSKKSSAYDVGKLRKKSQAHEYHKDSSCSELPHLRSRDSPDLNSEMVQPPPRSVSLPREKPVSSEPTKVYARANSFQPDSQARHVHPKLPDYDDLAARFAALRGR